MLCNLIYTTDMAVTHTDNYCVLLFGFKQCYKSTTARDAKWWHVDQRYKYRAGGLPQFSLYSLTTKQYNRVQQL